MSDQSIGHFLWRWADYSPRLTRLNTVAKIDFWPIISNTKPCPTSWTSDILQRSATDEQREAHINIADLIIQWKQNGESLPGTSRKLQISERTDWSSLLNKWFPAEYHQEIQALIEDFDLIPVTEERTV